MTNKSVPHQIYVGIKIFAAPYHVMVARCCGYLLSTCYYLSLMRAVVSQCLITTLMSSVQ